MAKEFFETRPGSDSLESNKPKEKTTISRRNFSLTLAKTGAAIGLGVFALAHKGDLVSHDSLEASYVKESENNWEKWQQKMLEELREALDYANSLNIRALAEEKAQDTAILPTYPNTVESWQKTIETGKEQDNKKYSKIVGLLPEVKPFKIYRGYLRALVGFIEMEKDELLEKTVYEKYISYKAILSQVELFLDNVVCSEKIKQDFGVSVSGNTLNFFKAKVELIYEDFKGLPVFTVRESGLKKINLKELEIGGAKNNSSPEEGMTFDPVKGKGAGIAKHELTHQLDSKENGADKAGWNKLNEGATPYLYTSGSDAIKKHKSDGTEAMLNEKMPGYARRYGQEGGIFEDKATISQCLLDNSCLQETVHRAAIDPILKRKLEFMAGYKLDNPCYIATEDNLSKEERDSYKKYSHLAPQGWRYFLGPSPERQKRIEEMLADEKLRHAIEFKSGIRVKVLYNFGTPIKDEEYRALGFLRRDYWSVWSRDSNGKVWMDADYYNAIYWGNSVTFKEEQGKTVRQIAPIYIVE